MDKNRLLWASRRGMLELDLWLLPFVEKIYPTLSSEEQALYHDLLECEDPDLFAWLMGHRVPSDENHLKIITIIRETRKDVR